MRFRVRTEKLGNVSSSHDAESNMNLSTIFVRKFFGIRTQEQEVLAPPFFCVSLLPSSTNTKNRTHAVAGPVVLASVNHWQQKNRTQMPHSPSFPSATAAAATATNPRMLFPARDVRPRLLREQCQLELTLFPQVDHLPASANAIGRKKISPKRRVDLFPEKLFFCIRVLVAN